MNSKANSARLVKKLEEAGSALLSPYLTAGFPSKALTVPLMHQMVKAGCDIIELGLPFSEPMAEGVTIQHAMEVALANKTTPHDVFDMVAEFRKTDQDTPIIIMGYMNSVEIIGLEQFAKQAQQVGVDGTIIVDLPPEESLSLFKLWQQHQLDPILLCSPTTSEKRMALIAQHASAYVYYVSLKGVTGSQSIDIANVQALYQKRKQALGNMPLLVGFGIKTEHDAAALAEFADGIVIGAALIETINKAAEPLEASYNFLKPIKDELKKISKG